MECSSLYNKKSVIGTSAFFPRTTENINYHTFPSTCTFPLNSTKPFATLSSSFTVKCYGQNYGDEEPLSASLAYDVLGVAPNCSTDELKSAFRNKVKKFHPDVRRDGNGSDKMIRRVIQAYEKLSNFTKSEIIERECLDPFDQPEGEAFDLFVDETVCIGKGCPFSCVKKAPHAFTFSSLTGTAQATSQGHGEDYQVHLAAGQCPRSCIHYVTPSQRIVLEELLGSIMSTPYDTSAEADLLYSLIVKARFENNRYQKPKKQPKASTEHVDWF
ncbi:chaperone protein dnaJ C76, chloroplastic isoform X2 [Solanum pennellii]|uniref:Chaperone protein dnaJ C76, chloroplastic isoform X2 n=1 Tax=Solanum pennellii TaxID=28526 RepID=A0ABM1FWP2_SOLPN|nr:chaperone protein dnaJ C76, chloroplastic isoform X2 [Solanum pennellii]